MRNRLHLRSVVAAIALLLGVGGLAAAGPDLAHLKFLGHFRGPVKTVMLPGEAEVFESVSALRQTLKPDQVMRSAYPAISSPNLAPSRRVDEEKRVVRVTGVLLAVKLETGASGDNDFHCIVGDAATGKLLNVEVSGVPLGAPAKAPKFVAVRQQLIDIVGESHLKQSYYQPRPPIPVTVTGSLYFDGDHTAGSIGPSGARPDTVWEIHPAHQITSP